MSLTADPQLLSLLQKISNPIEDLAININLKGIYAPPEQWYNFYNVRKLTDEANPNIFTY
jgi:hypothetical protein